MYVKSKILCSPHAFSTRKGGVSAQPHTASLNLAFGRGDDDATVLQNLQSFAQNVGFDAHNIVSLPQVHSDRIFSVTRDNCGQGYYVREGTDSGDGYVTTERGVVLGIKTADCVPILFEAKKNERVVAIGAVHAGWRGTVAGIAAKCVDRLKAIAGVDASDITAAIGPCIHKCCYEVSRDVYDAVKRELGAEVAHKFVIPNGKDGKYICDLAMINRELLLCCGLDAEHVDVIDECTCCLPEKYYSHRYSNGVRGTMLNVIFME